MAEIECARGDDDCYPSVPEISATALPQAILLFVVIMWFACRRRG